jgi:galactose mutarotase-like enzyme
MADVLAFPTARERIVRSGETVIGVMPNICLVSHFQVGNWPVLYRASTTGNVHRWGLPLMIPNFSRLKNGVFLEKNTKLPIHGFGRLLPWDVTAQDEASLTMQLMSSEATRASYPYEFTFTAAIAAGAGTLTYTVTMENRGAETMPIAPGFHPYFAVAQQDKPRVVSSGPPGFAAAAFDWDNYPPDNPYPFPHSVTVAFPERGALTIEELPIDGAYALSTMQVWSEPASAPDHDFICFEPTVSSEDALNRPADRLNIAPGHMRQFVLRLKADRAP